MTITITLRATIITMTRVEMPPIRAGDVSAFGAGKVGIMPVSPVLQVSVQNHAHKTCRNSLNIHPMPMLTTCVAT